jgi:amino acid adenylation domain-containing protein
MNEPTVARERTTETAPTSFAQQRLWFLEQYEPGTRLYNIPSAFHLVGDLDALALERSLQEIVRRHEVLRTTFVLEGDVPVQVIAKEAPVTLRRADVRTADDPVARAEALVEADAALPFDLDRGPLLRALLVRLSARAHVLALTLHHIVCDGWSSRVLLRELTALYEAFVAGRESPLPPLPLQYADFAAWQREWLRGETLEAQLEFWRRTLAGAPPALALPIDRPRPPAASHRGATVAVPLTEEVRTGLRAQATRARTTVFMTTAAAFALLLSRHSGQDDVCIGYPVANRNRREVEGLVGFFVNTLVLRVRIVAGETFEQLQRRVREAVLDADAHQDLPFEKLVEELRPERDPARSPLFQVVLADNSTGAARLELPGIAASPFPIDHPVAKFELTLSLADHEGSLHASLTYNVDLFDRETVERLAGQLAVLLAGVLDDPLVPVEALPLLGPSERALQLLEWNATRADFARDRCLHELFEAQAARTPEATAVVFEDRQLTYGALDAQADRLAAHLRARQVGRGALVALCAERSLALVPALLGILKAGGAYVPLDPAWPDERLARLLGTLEARVVVTTRAQLSRLTGLARGAALFCLDGAPDDADGDHTWPFVQAPPTVEGGLDRARPTDPAYVIFTSGSTGEPKGVVMAHRPVVNLIEWVNGHARVTSADRMLFLTSPCFDLSVYDVFGILAAGGVVDVVPEHVLEEPAAFAAFVRDRPVTFWDSAPAALRFLTALMPAGGESVAARALRVVFLSGDWIPLDMPADVHRLFPGARLVALGGATEAAIWSNSFDVGAIDPHWRSIPYGRPIQNARYYVLDERLEPVPIGVAGDLYIGGDCLAAGYWRDPALTAERFLPDPHDPRPGGRMYRTGDTARFFADGALEFLGRRDQQVKVRGYRVELGEVEAALLACPGVREAVVHAHGEPGQDRRLVAYVVPEAGAEITDAAVRTRLRETLPDFMVPSGYVFLPALPLSANGKVDRRRLPAPEAALGERDAVHVPPRTPTEALLAGLWAEVLHVDRVGVHDNFFALGGYSLKIVQVVALLRDRHGLELPVRDVFGSRDLAELARRVDARGARTAIVPGTQVPVASRARGPQSYRAGRRVADEVLWSAAHFDLRRSWFQYQFSLHAHDADDRRVQRALRSVVELHPVLAARFALEGGDVWMHEGRFDDLELTVAPEAGSVAAAREHLLAAPRRPFDRLTGPLCRFTIVPMPDGGSVLSVQVDHGLFDLQSQDVVMSDLAAALASGDEVPDVGRAPLYSDYCRWHRSVLTDERWEALRRFWRAQFPEPIDPYPALFGAPERLGEDERWQHRAWALDARHSTRADALAAEQGVTPLVLFMAFFRLWARDERSVRVFELETDVLGRVHPAFERTVGFFSTNLVLRFETGADLSPRQAVAHTAGVFADGLAHQELPFFALKQIANPALDPARYHWPIKFSQQTTAQGDDASASWRRTFSPVVLGQAGGGAHPLCIYLTGGPGRWRLDFIHDANVVSRETVASLARAWQDRLSASL